MTDPESLWSISEAEIRADEDGARKLIVANKPLWFNQSVTARVRVLREFLLACTFNGAGEVTRNQRKNILWSITNLEDTEGLSLLSELSHELISYGNIDPNWREAIQLRALSGLAESVAAAEDTEIEASTKSFFEPDWHLESDNAESVISKFQDLSELPLKDLTEEWSGLRLSVASDDVRFECDIWLIRKAILSSSPTSLKFIDQIFHDDNFWSSNRVMEWAENIGPIRGDSLGTIATAALNSRLRKLVPQLFLRNPDSLVIDKLVRSETIESVQFNQFLEQSKQIFYAICDVEFVLQKPRLTKKELQRLLEALENSLLQLRTKRFGKKGKLESFDPDLHLSKTLVEIGTQVEILESGLKSSENDQVFIKAKVIEASEESSDPASKNQQPEELEQ
jgi:hypothetical protein